MRIRDARLRRATGRPLVHRSRFVPRARAADGRTLRHEAGPIRGCSFGTTGKAAGMPCDRSRRIANLRKKECRPCRAGQTHSMREMGEGVRPVSRLSSDGPTPGYMPSRFAPFPRATGRAFPPRDAPPRPERSRPVSPAMIFGEGLGPEKSCSMGVRVHVRQPSNSGALFLHIPKTGGTWVEHTLGQIGIEIDQAETIEGVTYRHAPLPMIRKEFRFTFTFVRHPLSWYESWWKFQAGLWRVFEPEVWHPQSVLERCESDDFKEFIRLWSRPEPGLREPDVRVVHRPAGPRLRAVRRPPGEPGRGPDRCPDDPGLRGQRRGDPWDLPRQREREAAWRARVGSRPAAQGPGTRGRRHPPILRGHARAPPAGRLRESRRGRVDGLTPGIRLRSRWHRPSGDGHPGGTGLLGSPSRTWAAASGPASPLGSVGASRGGPARRPAGRSAVYWPTSRGLLPDLAA